MLAIAGVVIATISMVYSWVNSGKEMESRLTALESNQFTAEDRRCLYGVDVKMQTIWRFFERDLPAVIRSPHTPELDLLLDKAADGLGQMKVDEVKRLYTLVNLECEQEKPDTPSLRIMTLSMYRSFLQHEISALNILI